MKTEATSLNPGSQKDPESDMDLRKMGALFYREKERSWLEMMVRIMRCQVLCLIRQRRFQRSLRKIIERISFGFRKSLQVLE